MKLSEYNFHLPEHLIAKEPLPRRDQSRLMVFHRATGEIEHRESFRDLLEYFDEGDVFVVNDAKVFPCVLEGEKERGKATVRVLLLRELNPKNFLWDAVVEPARKVRVGNCLYLGDKGQLVAEVVDNTTAKGRTLRFLFDGTREEIQMLIESQGLMPIPDYLKRSSLPEDLEWYQTIFARVKGAIAISDAGRHFTPHMLKMMEIRGIALVTLTLLIGMPTLRKVMVEDLSKHKMESEYFEIPETTAERINQALDEHKRVLVVGASTLRALESSVTAKGRIKPNKGWTELFLFPPYIHHYPKCYLTNFHPPKSITMIATGAVVGERHIMRIHKEAVEKEYRFGCYGDALLVV